MAGSRHKTQIYDIMTLDNIFKPKADHSTAAKSKKAFLKELQKPQSVEAALEAAGLEFMRFYGYLEKDREFSAKFDSIVNLKLELAFLDAALKTKSASILSFALSNRLPEKYNKSKPAAQPASSPQGAQIIFTELTDDTTAA
ncbi:hypothetical protein AAIR98_001260 [Elusimicrobium simillimum]|uniref:hypothetical protein n=1 Tax=Elusimicrobium simillimum TaxID=3143438 RepID=UPI003C700DCE